MSSFELLRCRLKFATKEDLFDHTKLAHGILEQQLSHELRKESRVEASNYPTLTGQSHSCWIDGENSSEDGQMHKVRYTRCCADQEIGRISEAEMSQTRLEDIANNSQNDIADQEKSTVQRTYFNILPKHQSIVNSAKRHHDPLQVDSQRFVFQTESGTDLPQHDVSVSDNRASSPKSKRKRTIPVACRSAPKQNLTSDTSSDDSDGELYDIHKSILKDNVEEIQDIVLPEGPARATDNGSITENMASSEAADESMRVDQAVHDAPQVNTEWSLAPFVGDSTRSPGNVSSLSDDPVATPGGDHEKLCLYCDYKYVDFEEYSQHYTDRHVNNSELTQDATGSPQLLGEPFSNRSNKIKEVLLGQFIIY